MGTSIVETLEMVRDAIADLTQQIATEQAGGSEICDDVLNMAARITRQGKTLEGIVRRQAEVERKLSDTRGTVRLMIAALFDEDEAEQMKGQGDGPDRRSAEEGPLGVDSDATGRVKPYTGPETRSG